MTQPRLLDQLRDKIRLKHYSIRTEHAYSDWVRRYILFHNKRHPSSMGKEAVEAFLTHLAVEGKVAASTQNQAKSAILFLYREVLAMDLPWLDNVEQAKAPRRLPVVLTQTEVAAVLEKLPAKYALMARLAYGCGLRLMECLRLRVKDIDFRPPGIPPKSRQILDNTQSRLSIIAGSHPPRCATIFHQVFLRPSR